jgi:U6 snRNA-associated Sm-like protein LSm7
MNLVLDSVEENLRGMLDVGGVDLDPDDGTVLDQTRSLGLVVCRGPTIVLISIFAY